MPVRRSARLVPQAWMGMVQNLWIRRARAQRSFCPGRDSLLPPEGSRVCFRAACGQVRSEWSAGSARRLVRGVPLAPGAPASICTRTFRSGCRPSRNTDRDDAGTTGTSRGPAGATALPDGNGDRRRGGSRSPFRGQVSCGLNVHYTNGAGTRSIVDKCVAAGPCTLRCPGRFGPQRSLIV